MGLWAIAHGLAGRAAGRPGREKTVFGVRFPNPIGLAAGFDKDGVALNGLKHLGFGFVEVGTVTRHAQPGNPKPRLFRLPKDKAVINRMGFNNHGADALARRLENANPGIPVGINIGKSKVTALEEAASDYAYSFRLLAQYGDYVVVNVSSPNTPGLRGLQERAPLVEILSALKDIDSEKPLFVKIAPDLDDHALADVASVVADLGLTGVVATNTTVSREGLSSDPGEQGGLSGLPLRERASDVLRSLRDQCGPETVLIGVGGIMSGEDARSRLAAGADLVQVYTGWVYGGPTFVDSILETLE